jgi:hypothetical protein
MKDHYAPQVTVRTMKDHTKDHTKVEEDPLRATKDYKGFFRKLNLLFMSTL